MPIMWELEKDVKEAVQEEWADELRDAQYPEDLLHEIVDGSIPVYYHELATALSEDTSLAYVEDEGLVDVEQGVYHIIQVAIYERLSAVAYEALEELRERWEDEEEGVEA